jgi:hypothetical protein
MPNEERISFRMLGRGRRISPELKRRIIEQLKRGVRPSDAVGEFRVSYFTVAKYRRLLGDFDNRRGRKKKLSPAVLEFAEKQLRQGASWSSVAANCGVCRVSLFSCLKFRKLKSAPQK